MLLAIGTHRGHTDCPSPGRATTAAAATDRSTAAHSASAGPSVGCPSIERLDSRKHPNRRCRLLGTVCSALTPTSTVRACVPPAVPQEPCRPRDTRSSSQYPYPPQQQPAAPQQQPPPPPAQYGNPQWAHSESTYPGGNDANGFHYHPFRPHLDGGGTLTEKSKFTQDFADGWNAGLGFTWYPTSHLPLGLRLDGTYNEFNIRNPLLAQVAQANGTGVYHGFQRMWGGDTDLESLTSTLLAPCSTATCYCRRRLEYKQQTIIRQGFIDGGYGYGCDWCGFTVARYESNWTFARNAGLGLEFAMGPEVSLFIEGRYMRLNPTDAKSDYIPIRAGLRF